ncbi:hypothetical protein PI124_g15066 [Phytophthora idaei]|nr:hypothetical protein PI124_g15066 [Phytophthora idaei]
MHATNEIDALPSSELIGDNFACEPVATTDEEVPEAPSEELSGYIGSSAPTMFPSPVSTPRSKYPYSRASEYGTAVHNPTSHWSRLYMRTRTRRSRRTALNVWVLWALPRTQFEPDTGYHGLTAMRTQIELSREVVRDANRREKIINDLMITNLMDDVKLGSVNPEKELCRLNPGAEITSNPNVALAQYCTHLLHELYLRHPVLVISVDNHGDGLAQLYSYKDHTISDSDPSDPLIREIGVYSAHTTDDTSEYLSEVVGTELAHYKVALYGGQEIVQEGPCPTRVPLNSSTRLHAHAYETLLQTADISQLSLEDSLKYAIVTVVNSEELETCCQQNRRVFVIPVEVLPDFSSETQDGLLTVARWAVTSPLVARNLFGFLPYPELSAKTIPFELLCPWGR